MACGRPASTRQRAARRQVGETAARCNAFAQQRRGLPAPAEGGLHLLDVREDRGQAEGVGLEHRPAAPGGIAVAVHQHEVDGCGGRHDAFGEDARAFVDHGRAHAALDQLGRDGAARDAEASGRLLDERGDGRVHLALAVHVAVPAAPGLLAEAALLAQGIGHG